MQTTPSWMQHAGLLGGLGPRAFVPRVEGDALASDLSFRTCIEAGSGALVSVQAPGARRLPRAGAAARGRGSRQRPPVGSPAMRSPAEACAARAAAPLSTWRTKRVVDASIRSSTGRG